MRVLIIGGAGFIGVNAAHAFLKRGDQVAILDNLSRLGTSSNLEWLKTQGSFDFVKADICNEQEVHDFISSYTDADAILHLAAQVAVTTSVKDPKNDFYVNALGTFHVLEAMRKTQFQKKPLLIYASTNKVYGKLSDVQVSEHEDHYAFTDLKDGISEDRPLDLYSPYGCSKGAGDQYVLDYSRIYGLRTTSFRQSCIYGYRQFGIEDQGWVAWFTIATQLEKPLTIYGNGKQVRDVLFIDDLIGAYMKAIDDPDAVNGKAYNIGGGPSSSLSLLQLIKMLEKLSGGQIKPKYGEWRPGDQHLYISDIRRLQKDIGWSPKIMPQEGVKRLHAWVSENSELFKT